LGRDSLQFGFNSFAANFLAPSAGFLGGKNLKTGYLLTFVNTATIIANGTEGVLSTLVANGTGTVSTIVAKGSERVKKKNSCIHVSVSVEYSLVPQRYHSEEEVSQRYLLSTRLLNNLPDRKVIKCFVGF